ncbi:MAG: alpha/beta hydrolase [Bacteroidales bacterium]|nr:alpha/beta hydrolase [Bacteroidales bacterium]
MPFCKIAGKKIHYSFVNQHLLNEKLTPIVFLHEGLGSIEQWKDFPKKICSILNLPGILYDRYGYGKSEGFSEPRTIEYLQTEAEIFLPGILAFLKIEKPVFLFGHSDGASIALIYAGLFPTKVIAIVSEAAHVIIEDISRNGIKAAIYQFQNSNLKKILEKYHGNNSETMFYAWANTWISKESKNWNICNFLEAIICPVLVIQGENDEYGSLRQIQLITKHCKANCSILQIPECGHIPHFEKQEHIIEETNEFFKSFL